MIFFYYGENSWLARQKIKAIKKKFQSDVDPSGHNILNIDGEDVSASKFFESVSASGFLASKKLLIVKNIFNNKKLGTWQDALLDFLSKQKDTAEENYIIFWQTDKPDVRTKLYKALKKFHFVEEFKNFSSAELIAWLKKQAQIKNRSLDDITANILVAYVGNDLWSLQQELEKLIHFTTNSITPDDVKNLVVSKVDDNIFNLVEAIGQQNKALALKLMDEKFNSGTNAQYLLSMIVRQYRLLIKVKALSKQASYSGAIAQALKLPPWLADKAFKQSQLYTAEQLKKIYSELLELDQQLKSSALSEPLLFTRLIAHL
jgi:DNA polymerase-3 subunit delta